MTTEYQVTEIDWRRADAYRRNALAYGAISAVLAAWSAAHFASGSALFGAGTLGLAGSIAMASYAMILSRAVVLTGGQMGGFAAVRWLGGWHAVLFSKRVPEIQPPHSN